MPFASFHPLFIYHWWFLLSEQAVLSLPKGNGSSQSRLCFLLQMQRASLGSGGSFFYKWRYFLSRGTVLLLIIEDSLSSFSHVLDGYLFHCPNLIDASIPASRMGSMGAFVLSQTWVIGVFVFGFSANAFQCAFTNRFSYPILVNFYMLWKKDRLNRKTFGIYSYICCDLRNEKLY